MLAVATTALLVLVVAGAVRAQTQPKIYNNTNCGKECSEVPKDNEEGSICFDGACVQCNPTPGSSENGDCMCPPGWFCDKDPLSDTYTQCADMKAQYDGEDSHVGKPCDPELSPAAVTKGDNYESYCGLLMFNGTDTPVDVNWQGFCFQGICRTCEQEGSSGTGACRSGARECIAGNMEFAPLTYLSWSAAAQVPFSFASIIILLWLYCCFPCCLMLGGWKWSHAA